MRNDIYTKAVLTVIAIMLSVIALRPIVRPETSVQAQGFAGASPVGGSCCSFFDGRTGDVWIYDSYAKPSHYRMSKLGAPLTEVK